MDGDDIRLIVDGVQVQVDNVSSGGNQNDFARNLAMDVALGELLTGMIWRTSCDRSKKRLQVSLWQTLFFFFSCEMSS